MVCHAKGYYCASELTQLDICRTYLARLMPNLLQMLLHKQKNQLRRS